MTSSRRGCVAWRLLPWRTRRTRAARKGPRLVIYATEVLGNTTTLSLPAAGEHHRIPQYRRSLIEDLPQAARTTMDRTSG